MFGEGCKCVCAPYNSGRHGNSLSCTGTLISNVLHYLMLLGRLLTMEMFFLLKIKI